MPTTCPLNLAPTTPHPTPLRTHPECAPHSTTWPWKQKKTTATAVQTTAPMEIRRLRWTYPPDRRWACVPPARVTCAPERPFTTQRYPSALLPHLMALLPGRLCQGREEDHHGAGCMAIKLPANCLQNINTLYLRSSFSAHFISFSCTGHDLLDLFLSFSFDVSSLFGHSVGLGWIHLHWQGVSFLSFLLSLGLT